MIWLLTAMNCEGCKIANMMGDDMTYIVMGIGPENAACSVKKIIDSGKAGPFDKIVNVGVCGSGEDLTAGEIYFINKITDMVTGKDYYPDLSLFGTKINEGHLFTSDDIVRDPKPGELYDEEAAAIFEAGQKFFSPDSMLFLKIISDHGTEIPTKDQVSDMVLEKKDIIRSAIEKLMARAKEQEEYSDIPDLSIELCLTQAMKNDMNNLLRYAKAAGKLDLVEDYISGLKETGELPAKSKREGAVYAKRIKDMLTE